VSAQWVAKLTRDERDRLAEAWLTRPGSGRTSRWYIGDATAADWDRAYAAVDGGWRP
jgi:hypothetical protein